MYNNIFKISLAIFLLIISACSKKIEKEVETITLEVTDELIKKELKEIEDK
jgi:hypothetical protein